MKNLDTIQKAFKIFMTLSRIAMILSFIWAGVTLAGTFCAIAWYCGGTVMGMSQETLLSFPLHVAPNQMLGVLLSEMIFALTNGVLLLFAFRYFKAEQEDGTPFTHSGADQIKCLGIQTIAMLFVAAIFASLVFEGFDLYSAPVVEWDNMTGVALGIVMILASFVFRYGAELEESCAYDISVGSLWNMAAKESCGKEQ